MIERAIAILRPAGNIAFNLKQTATYTSDRENYGRISEAIDAALNELRAILPPPAGDGMQPVAWDVQEFKIWKGIDTKVPRWHGRGFACSSWADANDLLIYLQHNDPALLLRVAPTFASPHNAVPDGFVLVPKEPTLTQHGVGLMARDRSGHSVTEVYRAMVATSPIVPSPSEGVTVKPLEWELQADGATWHAKSILGTYAYWPVKSFKAGNFVGVFAGDTVAVRHRDLGDNPRTAAQSDYDALIKSALEPSPSNSRAKAMEAEIDKSAREAIEPIDDLISSEDWDAIRSLTSETKTS